MIWLVYRITGSPFLLGVAAFAAEIPFLFISPFGGLIADRMNRRLTLMAVQCAGALQALTLAALVWAGWATYPLILLLAMIQGIGQSMETPLRQALFQDFIHDPRDLPNAV